MMVNDNNKFCSEAEYFYNEYIDMFCIVNTKYAFEDKQDMINAFESPNFLTEIPMPEYITEDYDDTEW